MPTGGEPGVGIDRRGLAGASKGGYKCCEMNSNRLLCGLPSSVTVETKKEKSSYSLFRCGSVCI